MKLALIIAFCSVWAMDRQPFVDYTKNDVKSGITYKMCRVSIDKCTKENGYTCFYYDKFILKLVKEKK